MKPEAMDEWRGVAGYFVLTCLLTLPFWIAGHLVQTRLMPGLSVAAFAVVAPAIAAGIMAALHGGRDGVRSLLAAIRRPGRHWQLIIVAAVTAPVLTALASPRPNGLSDGAPLDLVALFPLVPILLVAAATEELGWSAFATERLSRWLDARAVGVIVGVGWALWHVPALIDLGRSADWIAWWSLWSVAQRVVMVWLYLRGGSWIWGPILFHAASNLAWQAHPDAFDPRIEGLAMATIAILVALPWSRKAG